MDLYTAVMGLTSISILRKRRRGGEEKGREEKRRKEKRGVEKRGEEKKDKKKYKVI